MTNKIESTDVPAAAEVGTIIPEQSTIKRTIGVEIECLIPHVKYHSTISALGGIGADIHGDGSISSNSDDRGVEVVTKPLKGNAAEDTIRNIAKILNDNDTEVNKSTGLHVHCDASEIAIKKVCRPFRQGVTPAEGETLVYVPRVIFTGNDSETYEVISLIESSLLVDVVGAYGPGKAAAHYGITNLKQSSATGAYLIPIAQSSQYECYVIVRSYVRGMAARMFRTMRFMSAIDPILRGLVPSSRRHNRYCYPLEKKVRSGGACPATLKEVMQGMGDRYCGINFRALEKYGTLENRYHQGTTNSEKIIHWSRLWEGCVRFALTSSNVDAETDTLLEVANTEARLEMLCALLDLPASTTEHMQTRFKSFKASDARLTIRYVEAARARARARAKREAVAVSM